MAISYNEYLKRSNKPQQKTGAHKISYDDYQQKYFNVAPSLPLETIDGYTDTGKRYGDYYYNNYAKYKDTPIYEKDGLYYLQINGNYSPMGKIRENKDGTIATYDYDGSKYLTDKEKETLNNGGAVLTAASEKYNKKDDEAELTKAISEGYKSDRTLSSAYKKADKAFNKLKKEYNWSDKDLQNYLENGTISYKKLKVNIITKEMRNALDEANRYKKQLDSGKIQKYNTPEIELTPEQKLQRDLKNVKEKTLIQENEKAYDVYKKANFKRGQGYFQSTLAEDTSPLEKFVATSLDTVSSGARGLTNWVERGSDLLSYGLSDVLKLTGNDTLGSFADFLRAETAKDTVGEEFFNPIDEQLGYSSVLGEKSKNIVTSAAETIPTMGVGMSVPGKLTGQLATGAVTFAQSYTGAKNQALQEGLSYGDASKQGLIQGTAETISEQIFEGIPGMKVAGWGNRVIDNLSNGVSKYFGTAAGKMANRLFNSVGEGLEEIISNILVTTGQNLDKTITEGNIANLTNLPDELKETLLSQNTSDSFIAGLITSALLNTGTSIISNVQKQQLLKAYAKDNNMTESEAASALNYKTYVDKSNLKNGKISINGIELTEQGIDSKIAELEELFETLTSPEEMARVSDVIEALDEAKTEFKRTSIKNRPELYNKIKNEKQMIHSSGNLLDILKNDTIEGDFGIQVQNKGAIPAKYNGGIEGIKFKPDVVDIIKQDKLYKGDGGTNRAQYVKENTNLFNDIEELFNDDTSKRISKYNQINIKEGTSIRDVANTIEEVSIAQNAPQELIDRLNELGIKYEINKNTNPIYNSEETVYNKATEKEGVSNEFRTIQEESREKLNSENWGKSNKTIDETLRGRLQRALRQEIKRRGYSNSNNNGLLELESKGNKFNIYENVDGQTFHDAFEIARTYTDNGELVDLHSVEDYDNSTNYLSEDGMQGFAITKTQSNNSDIEIEFKDSKVRDKTGKLLKLYHGTIKAGFTSFDDNVIFLTDNVDIASDYAGSDLMLDLNNVNENLTSIKSDDGKNLYFKNVKNIIKDLENYTLNDIQALVDYTDRENTLRDILDTYEITNKNKKISEFDSDTKNILKEILDVIKADLNQYSDTDVLPIPLLSNEKVNGDTTLYTQNRKIYEVYANLKNPLIIDAKGSKITSNQIKDAKQKGYDGVIAHNTIEGKNKKGTTYIVFDKNNVKIAASESSGGGDLISVFNMDSTKRGFLRAIEPVIKKKAKTLDCYMSPNQDLKSIYEKIFGFKTASIMDYNMEYDHDGIAETHSEPQVAFMVNTNKDVETKFFDKDSYDEAEAYRNSFVESDSEPFTIAEKIEKAPEEVIKVRPTEKNIRSWSQTVTEGDYEGIDLVKEIVEDMDNTYMPQENQKGWDKATNDFNTLGYDVAMGKAKAAFESGKRIKLEDIMLGQKMLTEAAKRNDVENVSYLLQELSIAGTELGQNIQALSVIKRLTPEGQLKVLQKTIDRLKAKNPKSNSDLHLTDEMINTILDSETETDLQNNVDEVKKLLAKQMKGTLGDKLNAWRYFSMLGNPKTHIRNIVSNMAMSLTTNTKNVIARTIESTVNKVMPKVYENQNRTKTFKKTSKEVNDYISDYISDNKNILNVEGKYKIESQLNIEKKAFGKKKPGKLLQKAMDFNSYLLNQEDFIVKNKRFKKAAGEYLTANGITTKAEIDANPKLFDSAINYGIEEAWKATFQQYSALADSLNRIQEKNKTLKLVMDAVLPFKQTPINIARTGLEYSPIGLLKTVTKNSLDLKNGKIDVNQYIDNISKGLTGTGIMLTGYILAQLGILSAQPDDNDKEEQFEKALGVQDFSINIGDQSFTIDWLTPTSMPLLVGATISDLDESGGKFDLNDTTDMFMSTLQPLVELSFLQSVDNALSTYSTEGIQGSVEEFVKSYISQYVPTVGGQIAKTIDPIYRSTAASATSPFKFGEEILRQNMAKIPGLTFLLEPQTDLWGNEKERSNNVIIRAFENFIAPYSRTSSLEDSVSKEIQNIYSETGEDGVIPSIPSTYYYGIKKTVKFDNEEYPMTAEQYTEFKKTYGELAHESLEKLFDTNTYKRAADDDKVNMIENVYKYAKDIAKKDFLKTQGVKYTNTKKDNEKIYKDNNIKEAIESDISTDEVKYKNQYPTAYNTAKLISDDYDKYTSYKKDIDEIKEKYSYEDLSGKNLVTQQAKRKQAIINYVKNLRGLTVAQKAMLIKQTYSGYKNYDKVIRDYVKNSNLTVDEKKDILKDLNIK